MGAWIETTEPKLPTVAIVVAPFMGAWIETHQHPTLIRESPVAPFMGAWIETFIGRSSFLPGLKSHPSWVRGLKHNLLDTSKLKRVVAPFMGAWIETIFIGFTFPFDAVAPFMGAWIETLLQSVIDSHLMVAPFMGAWIETQRRENHVESRLSHPSWVRGLKRGEYTYGGPQGRRTLHGCVD